MLPLANACSSERLHLPNLAPSSYSANASCGGFPSSASGACAWRSLLFVSFSVNPCVVVFSGAERRARFDRSSKRILRPLCAILGEFQGEQVSVHHLIQWVLNNAFCAERFELGDNLTHNALVNDRLYRHPAGLC